jgi:hypothetical protein
MLGTHPYRSGLIRVPKRRCRCSPEERCPWHGLLRDAAFVVAFSFLASTISLASITGVSLGKAAIATGVVILPLMFSGFALGFIEPPTFRDLRRESFIYEDVVEEEK